MQIVDSPLENIRLNSDELFSAEKKVAEYILANVEEILHMSVNELSQICNVSEATIIRMCKHLGYKGFYQLKIMLAHDLGQSKIIGNGNTGIDTVSDFFQNTANNMYTISRMINNKVFKDCISLIVRCNTVHVIASGNTIPSALDFAFRLGRIEIAATSSISDELELSSINLARFGDIVIGISHSGGTNSVLKAFDIARRKGITTIAVTDIQDSPLNKFADYALVSGIETSNVYVFGAESHINTSVILDALIFFLVKKKRHEKSFEMFLPETKLDNYYL